MAMRISALSSLVVLVAAAGAAHADRKHSTTTREVAALAETARTARADRGPALFSAGTLALTGPARPARKEPFLSTGDVKAGVAPHISEIEHCYLDQVSAERRGGHLDLTLEIARDGFLVSVHAAAADLPAGTTHKIEACVREIVETVQFPARRNDTTAVVPYFFQKTDAPGAGPILSCWSPKGC
jgi:hypothetical protein